MIVVLFFIVEVGLYLFFPEIALRSWKNSFEFALQILAILPPVVLLIGLLDAWLPKSFIATHLGRKSGAKGMLIAILMGSVAAGPLFSAFPIAVSLLNKGSRIANVVVFLGSWATIKLPMTLMESHFLGIKFSILRTVVTIPFVLLIGVLVERSMVPASLQFPCSFPKSGPQKLDT